MFETRLYRISANDAIDKRKLWEGWLQWANRFSRLDSDNIARRQFNREHFTIDSFLELFQDGLNVSESAGLVSGDTGTMVAASKKFVSLDSMGEYWVNWSLTLKAKTGGCRFAGGVPFVGNTFIGSAQDFKAELGWYNNTSLTSSNRRSAEKTEISYETADKASSRQSFINEDWGTYGFYGHSISKPAGSGAAREYFDSQVRFPTSVAASSDQKVSAVKVHLSGAGAAIIGRSSGNIGILLFCEPGSTFQIVASRLTLHRRNR